MVPLSAARTLLTTLITNHLYLFEVTKEEVDKEMHIKRVVHLIINQQQAGEQQQSLHATLDSQHYTTTSPTSPPSTCATSSVMAHGPISTVGGPPNTVIDTRQVNSLIIGIKVAYGGRSEKIVVNVHLNKETTADDVLDMVLDKVGE